MKIQHNLTLWIIVIANIGIFILGLPILVWRGYASIDLLIQIASLLLSWPVIVLVLGLIAFTRFQSGIDAFLRNIAFMKLPGGVEIQAQLSAPRSGESETKEEIPTEVLTLEKIDAVLSTVEESQKLSAAERDRLESLYRQSFQWSTYWRRSYLSLFFVPYTKQILFWLEQNPGQSRLSFHTRWQSQIPDPRERETTLSVLDQYRMIQELGGVISVTHEGFAFLQFIGFVPPIPPPIPNVGA